MKSALFISTVALVAACSTSQESGSNATSSISRGKAIKFETSDRCLTVPADGDQSGRAGMQLARCSQEDRQSFLLSNDDIKAEGHFGPYLTEKSGSVVAGSSSPWAFKQNAAGKLVVASKVSNKCLVAGSTLQVQLGDCNQAAAAVQLLDSSQLPIPVNTPGAAGIKACSVFVESAYDCI